MEFLENQLENLAVSTAPSCTVVTKGSEQLAACKEVLLSATILALDCEGVDLGRTGQICLVQVSTGPHCFLFDVHEVTKTDDITLFLKEILENSSILKVIHDCKQDADALYHILGISLVHVFDTQIFEKKVHDTEPNLNNTLTAYGLKSNEMRSSSIYKENRAFWAVRPLTDQMIQWAAGDVGLLIDLHARQTSSTDADTTQTVMDTSNASALNVPRMLVFSVQLDASKMGLFIGAKGSNVQKIRQHFAGDAFLHTTHNPGEVLIYAKDLATRQKVVKKLAKYV